jgi:hypothetical protein
VKNVISGAHGLHWVIGQLVPFRVSVRTPEGRRKLEDLAVDLGIILKWILRK